MKLKIHRPVSSALLIACLAACAAAPSSEASSTAGGSPVKKTQQTLLPPPSGPLELGATAGTPLSLAQLLERLSKLTGVTFSPDNATAGRLKNATISLALETRVAPADVYPWVESLLQQNGFALALLEGGASKLVGVYYSSTPTQNPPPPLRIEASQLDECRAHPAFLFTTVLTLPHTDVRSLGNSLRILFPDTQSGGVIPVGTTNSVILNGNGRMVADLAWMLQSIDEKAGEAAALPKSP